MPVHHAPGLTLEGHGRVRAYGGGAHVCLHCRFHLLKPEYIHHRIKQLQKSYRLRIVLCYVDVEDVVEALSTVRKFCAAYRNRLFCVLSSKLESHHRQMLTGC